MSSKKQPWRPSTLASALLSASLCTAVTAQVPAAASAASPSPSILGSIREEMARFRAFPHFDRAYRLLRQQQDAAAVVELRAGLQYQPSRLDERLALIDTLSRLGRTEAALSEADAAIRQHPRAEQPRRRKVDLLIDAGRRVEAARTLDEFMALSPQQATAADRNLAVQLRQAANDAPAAVGQVQAPATATGALPVPVPGVRQVQPRRNAPASGPTADDLQSLGHRHFAAGEDTPAASAFRRAIALSPPGPQRAGLYTALGHTLARAGDARNAADAFQQAHRLQPDDPDTLVALATASAQAGDLEGAIAAQRESVRLRPSPSLRADLARLLVLAGRSGEAAPQWQQVLDDPQATSALREEACRQLVSVHMAQGDTAAARRILTVWEALTPQTAESHLDLGDRWADLDAPAQAVPHYAAALRLQPSARAHLGLGYAHAAQGMHEKALADFEQANATAPRVIVTAQLAFTHFALGQDRDGLRRGQAALQDPGTLPLEQRDAVLQAMAAAHRRLGRPQDAVALWRSEWQANPRMAVRLGLAEAQWAAGHTDAARQTLAGSMTPEASPAQRAAALDLSSRLDEREGRPVEALAHLEQAAQLQSTPDRTLRLARLKLLAGDRDPGLALIGQLEASQPDVPLRASIAQALYDGGEFDASAQRWSALVQEQPDQTLWLAAAGYAHMRAGHNPSAARSFRAVIDRTLAVAGAAGVPTAGAEDPATTLRQMRQEVSKLEKNLSFTVYENYRANGGSSTGAGGAGGSSLLPSQGGVELGWRPPTIGLQDDRTLRLNARLNWSHPPQSMAIDRPSVQGAVGVQYKPLREHDFSLSVDRLVSVGSQANDDWLLRATYGWSNGTGHVLDGRRHWNYTTLYTEVGRLTRQGVNAAYLEARQGRTLPLGEEWLVSPHGLLTARRQQPDGVLATYAETGLGVSLRRGFNASPYHSPRSNAEFLLQYRKGLSRAQSGWSATAVIAF